MIHAGEGFEVFDRKRTKVDIGRQHDRFKDIESFWDWFDSMPFREAGHDDGHRSFRYRSWDAEGAEQRTSVVYIQVLESKVRGTCGGLGRKRRLGKDEGVRPTCTSRASDIIWIATPFCAMHKDEQTWLIQAIVSLTLSVQKEFARVLCVTKHDAMPDIRFS